MSRPSSILSAALWAGCVIALQDTSCAAGPAPGGAAKRVRVGAIRWDAWTGGGVTAQVLKEGLEANTDKTICSADKLRQALRQVRRQGYATDIEEFTRGMLCLAAPVFDTKMNVVGALGLTVLTLHHSWETLLAELKQPVLEAAKAASEILGADMSHVPMPKKVGDRR